jgi:hypothetical protein
LIFCRLIEPNPSPEAEMHEISLSEAPADFIGTRALYELIFAK